MLIAYYMKNINYLTIEELLEGSKDSKRLEKLKSLKTDVDKARKRFFAYKSREHHQKWMSALKRAI